MNKSFLSILITATVLFSACRDELEQNNRIPIVEGDEINFGASNLASFGDGYSEVSRSRNSRTSYGDASFDGNKWHYPLNWVYGDQIKVYCGEAADAVARDYRIEWAGGSDGNVASDNSTAYMVKVEENGLHWGDINKKHHFYAFYPASSINNDGAFKEGVVHDTIPGTQEMVEWQENTINGKTVWVGKPNMEYAYMSADTIIDPKTADNKVGFEFKPLTTAVEITLIGKDGITGNGIPLTAVQITSEKGDKTEKQAVCGAFEHNILTGVTTVHNDNVATDYMITVPLWQKSKTGDDLIPLQLKGGDTVRFTVFLLPGTYKDSEGKETRTLKNLQVRVPGWNSGVRVKYYDGINLEVGTKSQIWLPDYDTNDKPNNWLGSLPDNVYISQLSIPGSVNAFSKSILPNYSYPGVGQDEMDLTQDLTVEQQFSYGVRAFEIATERYVPGLLENGNNFNLGTNGKIIAGTTTGVSVKNAIKELAQLVFDNPSEFVIVMPYYASHATSDTEMWTNQLKNYLQGLQGSIPVNGGSIPVKAFENSMTIGDARGCVLFLSRIPGGKDECENSWGLKPQYTTAIYGWDSDKDRWTNRGYAQDWDGNGDPASNGYNYNKESVENWKYDATIGSNAVSAGDVNFYIQDWLRVCKEKGSYEHQNKVGTSIPPAYTTWYASIGEKLDNINDFMTNTIKYLKTTTQANSVFINSLSGYYIVSKSGGTSADPVGGTLHPDAAKHGDIPPFAATVNEATYNYILNLDYNSRGPLGIVLINYAGVETYAEQSMRGDYIVKALVDNNFRFPLLGSSGK